MIKRKTHKNRTPGSSYFELLKIFSKEGCPICLSTNKLIDEYFDNLLYENVNDPFLRTKIRKSFGYCKKHSLQIERVAENTFQGSGLAIIIEDLSNLLLKKYEEIANTTSKKQNSKKQRYYQCPACSYQFTFEQIYASEIAYGIKEEAFFNEFKKSGGLCLHHLTEVTKHITDPDDLKRLIEYHVSSLGMIIRDINSFIDKQDYRNKERITAKEAEARKKALRKIIGEL
jgi:hypothetical protein